MMMMMMMMIFQECHLNSWTFSEICLFDLKVLSLVKVQVKTSVIAGLCI